MSFLQPNEVHIWRIDLDHAYSLLRVLERALSVDEGVRAARLPAGHRRRRWVLARGALRAILSRYVGVPPASLGFDTGPFGKPALTELAQAVQFNLTHTEGLALVAVSDGAPVGIDAEIIRDIEWRDISRSVLSPSETAAIQAMPTDRQLEAFFNCWVRKEALTKAIGTGFSTQSSSFSVEVRNDGSPSLLPESQYHSPWHLVDIGEAGVAAALAIQPSTAAVRRCDFGAVVDRAAGL